MKPIYYVLMIAVFMAMAVGCDDPCVPIKGKIILLTDADNGTTIEMNLNDQLKIILASNPSTGYSWENTLTEEAILVQEGDSVYVQDPLCGNQVVGCGGTETFSFKAVSTGTGQIKLIYNRSWETEEPIDQFEVTVIVNPVPECVTSA